MHGIDQSILKVGISRLLHDVLDGIPGGEGVMPEVDAQISLAFLLPGVNQEWLA
jgi:hypothetical protein